MITFKEYANREDWLEGRNKTLGASEVASALGFGYESTIDLWKRKTGKTKSADISGNPRVEYGTKAEEHIRALFALKHKDDCEVEYHAYRVYQNSDFPFLSCTLDGELVRKATGELGVYEGKTAWIMSHRDLENWENKIPNNYYAQVVEQLAVTNRDFVILCAELIFPDKHSEIREYEINRAEVESDIEYVVAECGKFWKYVEHNEEPPVRLTL